MVGWFGKSLGSRRKFALVIGNSAYAGDERLQSPARDIEGVKKALEALGFGVTHHPDLDVAGLNDVIRKAVDNLKSERADVGLFYYSGHGMQIAGRNFLVPVGFETLKDPHEDALIDLQKVTYEFAEHSATTLVFLDACRTSPNFTAKSQAMTTKAMALPNFDAKGFSVDGKPVGLAGMRSNNNSYIAFAAAPGQAAREGEPGRMSPFTNALVAHIRAVDLPLDMIMNRVNHDVFETTRGAQSPWMNSSLGRPFFFTPGSLLMLMGNLMALASLGATTVIYTLVLVGGAQYATGLIAFTLALISLTTLLLGAQRADGRLRGVRPDAVVDILSHFLSSARRGVFGGFIGAIGAAFAIGWPYMRAWEESCRSKVVCTSLPEECEKPKDFGALLVEFAVACSLVAIVLGFCALFAAKLGFAKGRWRFDPPQSWTTSLRRGALGGAVAGVLAAPPLTLYFGRFLRPILSPDLLAPGGVIGAAILAFAIVNFDFEQLTLRRVIAGVLGAFGGVLGGAVLGGAVFGVLYKLGVVAYVTDAIQYEFYHSKLRMIPWTWIYGFTAGIVLGSVIALAEVLTERWSSAAARNDDDAAPASTPSPG